MRLNQLKKYCIENNTAKDAIMQTACPSIAGPREFDIKPFFY